MATFYTLLHHEKSKWLLNVRENNSSGLAVIGIFQKNQLKNKYVEIKMENVSRKEGYCDIFIK